MEPSPPSALSVRGWSATVGANQSKIIDLLLSTAANLLAVTGAVVLFVAQTTVLRVIAAALTVTALVLVVGLRRPAGSTGC